MTNPQDPLFCHAVRIAFPNGAVQIAPIASLLDQLEQLEHLKHLKHPIHVIAPGLVAEIRAGASDLDGPESLDGLDTCDASRVFLRAVRQLPWNAVYPAAFRAVPDPKPRHSQWWGGEPFTARPSSLQVTLCSLRDYIGPRWTLGDDTHGTRPDPSDTLSLGDARELMAWLHERPDTVCALQNLPPTAETLFGVGIPLRLRIETEYETGDQALIAVVGASGRWGSDLSEDAYYTTIEQHLDYLRDAFGLSREVGLEFGPP